MAQTSVESLYDQHIPVQIIWKTSDEFNRMRRTINHVVANALRDGVIMPRNPENYGGEYHDDYEYEWTVTDERYRHARDHLQAFHTLIHAGASDNIIGQQAHSAMEHALKALISANGERYQQIHDINLLTRDALMADPHFQFDPALDGSVYDQYAGWQEYQVTQNPISHIADYQKIVNSDIQAILTRVQEIRPPRSE